MLNHLQDCGKDFAGLDRSYLPQDMLDEAGAGVVDVTRSAETPGLRKVFGQVLDQVDLLNAEAARFPRQIRDRRLRLEVGVIVGLARRLTRRLRNGDPLASRVKLEKADVAGSVLGALRWAA